MEYMNNVLATVRKELTKHKGMWPEIAREAEVSYSFVAHVSSGFTTDPRIKGLQRVLDVLKRLDEEGKI